MIGNRVGGISQRLFAASFVALAIGCSSGGGSGPSNGGDSDADAITDRLAAKIPGATAVLVNGNPPSASSNPTAPTVQIDQPTAEARPGDTVTVPVRFQIADGFDLSRLFAKVPGASRYFEVSVPNGGKAFSSAKAEQVIPVSFELSQSISTGQFCLDISGQDNQQLTSNKGNFCVTVKSVTDSTPDPLRIVGALNTPPNILDVAVLGNRAYVAGEGGLWVVDVSNPASPSLLGSVPAPGNNSFQAVVVAGDYAYIADFGLRVIDVSNPSSPQIVGSYNNDSTGTRGIAVSGARAYLAANNGLIVVDVSNPTAPTTISKLPLPAGGTDVVVAGNYAYVTVTDGMYVVDVSVPQVPFLVGTYSNTPGFNTEGIDISGSYVFIADTADGLEIVDVSNPGNPIRVGRVDDAYGALDVVVSGSRAYVAAGTGDLYVIDVGNPAQPSLVDVGEINGTYGLNAVAVSGEFAYLAAGGSGLLISVDLGSSGGKSGSAF